MIYYRPYGPISIWVALPEKNQNTREFQGFTRPKLDGRSSHGDPELLVRFDVLHQQMQLAHGHASVIRSRQLRPCGAERQYGHKTENENKLFHQDIVLSKKTGHYVTSSVRSPQPREANLHPSRNVASLASRPSGAFLSLPRQSCQARGPSSGSRIAACEFSLVSGRLILT